MQYKMKLLEQLKKVVSTYKKPIKVKAPPKPKVIEVKTSVVLEVKPLLRPIGIQTYDIATSSRSVCKECGAKIPKGVVRFMYRYKQSSSRRDERYIHAGCVKDVPDITRDAAADRATLKGWITNGADLPKDVTDVLRKALIDLGGGGAVAAA